VRWLPQSQTMSKNQQQMGSQRGNDQRTTFARKSSQSAKASQPAKRGPGIWMNQSPAPSPCSVPPAAAASCSKPPPTARSTQSLGLVVARREERGHEAKPNWSAVWGKEGTRCARMIRKKRLFGWPRMWGSRGGEHIWKQGQSWVATSSERRAVREASGETRFGPPPTSCFK
jgi:hypothetical protein